MTATIASTGMESIAELLDNVRVQLREAIAQMRAEKAPTGQLPYALADVVRELERIRQVHGVRPPADEWCGRDD